MTDDEHTEILKAIRLGWTLAEVRGRIRPDAPVPPPVNATSPAANALRLRVERTSAELCTELQGVIGALARDLGVDEPVAQSCSTSRSADLHAATESLREARCAAAKAGKDEFGETAQLWVALAEQISEFDAHIQDTLAAESDLQSCAYQLGRGLAETYWASEPAETEHGGSWKFLLDQRCDELVRLTGRIAPTLHQYTACAVAGSLAIWREVVKADDWWTQPTTRDELYAQVRRWYELLILEQDPTTLIEPFGFLRNIRTTTKSLRVFLPQLAGLGISLAVLLAAAFFATRGEHSTFTTIVTATVGFLGVSLSTVQAKLKSAAQAVTERLRQDAYTDLVATAITIVPPRRQESAIKVAAKHPTNRAVNAALRNRTLTSPVLVGT